MLAASLLLAVQPAANLLVALNATTATEGLARLGLNRSIGVPETVADSHTPDSRLSAKLAEVASSSEHSIASQLAAGNKTSKLAPIRYETSV